MRDSVYLFDTSSLIAFVRYYLPFDKDKRLKEYLLNGFKNKEFLLVKEVKQECEFLSQKLVFDELPELEKIKSVRNSEVISQKMHNLIDNNFIASKRKKDELTQDEYDNVKQKFIQSGDFGLIYYAMQDKSKYVILTEETSTPNDNKYFKKIPAICENQKIQCINLPRFFENKIELSLTFQNILF